MATKLKNIIQGDTKRWRLDWPNDIAGATVRFMMKLKKNQATFNVNITATLDDPDGEGVVLGGYFEITAAESGALALGDYLAEHEITLANGDVGTFLQQRLSVTRDLD